MPRSTRILLVVAFFASGAAGLGYQVAWGRWLHGVFGASAWAVAVVVAAFMAGLALGSVVAGRRLVGSGRDPLVLYGVVELGIAAWAVLLPWLLDGVSGLVGTWAFQWVEARGVYNGIRFGLAFAVLLVPTTLMGATLPLLAAEVGRRSEHATRWVGLLYGLNTLGAMAGTLLSGFVLIAWLGLPGTNLVFVGVNLAVGVAAVAHGRLRAAAPIAPRPPAADATSAEPGAWRRPVLALFLANGIFHIAYEVLWTRALQLVIGTTTYAFSLILAIYLAGIALGSLWMARRLETLRRPAAVLLGLQLFLGAWVLASPWIVNGLPRAYLEGLSVLGFGWGASIALKCLLTGVLVLPLTLAAGAVFPLGIHLVTAGGERMSADVGDLYAVNTAGGILGALAAGFLLVPWLGIEGALVASAVAHLLVVAAVALAAAPARRPLARRPLAWGAALAVALALPLFSGWDHRLLASGVYFQPATFFDGQGRVRLAEAMAGVTLRVHEEGVGATVDVLEAPGGYRALAIDGKSVATSNFYDHRVQRMLGLLPLLLHPEPKRALVIGLGTGMTAGNGALDPGLESITVVEIHADVARAAAEFGAWNEGILEDPRVQIVVEDAIHYLRYVDASYDIITSDPIHPFVAGAGDLYAVESYQAAKEKLAPGGILCQWVPLYQLARPDIDSILATFHTVFPDATVWVTGKDFVLCGPKDDWNVEWQELAARAQRPEIAAALEKLGIWSPLEVLSAYIGRLADLESEFAGARVNRVSHPVLEFSAPRSVFRRTDALNLERILAAAPAPGFEFLRGIEEVRAPGSWGLCVGLQWQGFVADRAGDLANATRLARRAYDTCPQAGFVRHFAAHTLVSGADAMMAEDPERAKALLRQARALDPRRPEIVARLERAGG